MLRTLVFTIILLVWGFGMELWMDLLFGNPIGLASVITVAVTFVIIVYILGMFIFKSGHHE